MKEEILYHEIINEIGKNYQKAFDKIRVITLHRLKTIEKINVSGMKLNELKQYAQYYQNLKDTQSFLNLIDDEMAKNPKNMVKTLKLYVNYIDYLAKSFAKIQANSRHFFQFVSRNQKRMGAVSLGVLGALKSSPASLFIFEGAKNIAKSTMATAGKAGLVFIAAPTVVTGGHWLSYKVRYPNEKIMSPVLWQKIGDSWVLSPRKGDLRETQMIKIRSIKDKKTFVGLEKYTSTSCLTGNCHKAILPVWNNNTHKNACITIARMFKNQNRKSSFVSYDNILGAISP